MQSELSLSHPAFNIRISAINEFGQESANATASAGRTLPLLQDVNNDSQAGSDTWTNWNGTWRDVIILDAENRRFATFNLTLQDLARPDNYAALKQLLIAASTLSADFNGDGAINRADLAIAVNNLGATGGVDKTLGDANGDGRVDLRDLVSIQRSFGHTAVLSSAAPAALVTTARRTTVIQAIDRAMTDLDDGVSTSRSLRAVSRRRAQTESFDLRAESTISDNYSSASLRALRNRNEPALSARRR